MSIFCVTCGLIILRSPTNARDAINPTVDRAWEYGVTPSLEASERWSESLFLRLSKVLSQVSTWPATVSESAIQAYQALLLNVIFTLEYLDDMRFRKAYPRYCMMIAIFRGASLFQEQQIFVQDDTQDMIPTSWLIREKFKRLAFYTFRLDNYFYFLQGHYPVLRYEELCLATPSSERLWEATTAEEWHEIKEIESKKRATMLFMTLMDTAMDCEGRDTLPPLLEDDYVYGICAMQTWVWRDIKRHRPCPQTLQSSEGSSILSTPASSRFIEYWSAMFTTWSECLRDRSIGSPLSSEKHRELLENCTPALYHFSQMSLRANLEAIQDLAMDRYHKQYSGPYRRQLESRILEWVRTSDARLALWHAAQVLKLLQETSDSMETRGSSLTSWRIDFIAPLALYKAGLIVWAYARSVQVCDSCSMGSIMHPTTSRHTEPLDLFKPQRGDDFREWLHYGGRGQIQGTIVCVCRLDELLSAYEAWLLRYYYKSRSVLEMAGLLLILKDKD
ncbi:hypothetical protein CEP51_001317 [Fusarium floridanum]|uniref:Xylanolytic transcriptional activator regulatory domain-containing protein n=1 Tax=Fusarium floridanum TaxID=1325733 RepID=A0A428SHQ9_9HYPO|nr:hypothetical protein CEP51_001317 [Fusarium floridanum]